jgi:hypothetical protein
VDDALTVILESLEDIAGSESADAGNERNSEE